LSTPGGILLFSCCAALGATATTRGARVGDDRPLAVAVTAGLGDREEPLLEPHLARARHCGQVRGDVPGFAPAPRTSRRRRGAARRRLLAAEGRLLEGDLELVAEILAARGRRVRRAERPVPKKSPNRSPMMSSKPRAEVEAGPAAALLEGGVSEAIVEAAPLGVGRAPGRPRRSP
jgi:hypothetical protein